MFGGILSWFLGGGVCIGWSGRGQGGTGGDGGSEGIVSNWG